MNFAAIINDDEHTGSVDAYERLMKSRKWLALAGAIALAIGHDFFTPTELSIAFAKIAIPAWAWTQIAAGALLYSASQYALLLVQLLKRYRQILSQRIYEKAEATVEQHFDTGLKLTNEYEMRKSIAAQNIAKDEHRRIADMELEKYRLLLESHAKRGDRIEDDVNSRNGAFILAEKAIDTLRIAAPVIPAALGALALAGLT